MIAVDQLVVVDIRKVNGQTRRKALVNGSRICPVVDARLRTPGVCNATVVFDHGGEDRRPLVVASDREAAQKWMLRNPEGR